MRGRSRPGLVINKEVAMDGAALEPSNMVDNLQPEGVKPSANPRAKPDASSFMSNICVDDPQGELYGTSGPLGLSVLPFPSRSVSPFALALPRLEYIQSQTPDQTLRSELRQAQSQAPTQHQLLLPPIRDRRGEESVSDRRRSDRIDIGDLLDNSSLKRKRMPGNSEISDPGSADSGYVGSPAASDVPVKYTPVTGRISRQRKGTPVHICYICKPAKTFTRAEHLRRHQLSHRKPAYTCTFNDCDRAFHRPDLLGRHLQRHEAQGEKPYKTGSPRDRARSSSCESNSITVSTIAKPPSSFDQINSTTFHPTKETSPDFYHSPSRFGGLCMDNFPNLTTSDSLPLLRIPEETYIPGLTYSDSSSAWTSSASDSASSTQFEGSRNSRSQFVKGPSAWLAPSFSFYRVPIFDSIAEDYKTPYTPPRMSPPFRNRQLLDVPNSLGGFYMESRGSPEWRINHKDLGLESKQVTMSQGSEGVSKNSQSSSQATLTCLVESCPYSKSQFLTHDDQIVHYKLAHKDRILRCQKEECIRPPLFFICEDDQAKHYTSQHLNLSSDLKEESKGMLVKDELRALELQIKHEKEIRQRLESECDQKYADLANFDFSTKIKQESTFEPEGFLLEDSQIIGKCAESDTNGALDDCSKIKSEPPHKVTSNVGTSDSVSDPPVEEASDECHLKEDCGSLKVPFAPREVSSSPTDGPTSFETDSAFSGDGEESEDEYHDESSDPSMFSIICDELRSVPFNKEDTIVAPVLDPAKQELIDIIMKEFWAIFNHEWSTNVRKCTEGSASASSSPPPNPNSGSSSGNSQNNVNKRAREDDGGHPSDNGNGNRDGKRLRITDNPNVSEEETTNFACPYRKNNPRKYTHRTRLWRSCAMTSFDTVARLKQHLYRYHRIFQCERCNELFPDEKRLKAHFLAVKGCELEIPSPADGITDAIEKRLRCRKKTHREQSQEARWKEIYTILFPNQIVPSAYFEPPQDEVSQSPVSSELASYEEYSRQELPRVFRRALEAAVTEQTQSIGDLLRSQLVSMIQESQDRVFSTYRSRAATNQPDSENTQPRDFEAPPQDIALSSSSATEEGSALMEGTGLLLPDRRSTGMLDSFFQSPPHAVPQVGWDSRPLATTSDISRLNRTSDSGYTSNSSVMNSSSSIGIDGMISSATLPMNASLASSSSQASNLDAPPHTFASLLDDETRSGELSTLMTDPNLFQMDDSPELYGDLHFDWHVPVVE